MVASTEIERRAKILDYLQQDAWNKALGKDKDKKINKAEVMRHFESISRLNSTHKTIVDLIKEKKITVVKDNPRSQTHYLVINNDNKINKLNQRIAGVESVSKNIPVEKRLLTREEQVILDIFIILKEIEEVPLQQDSQMLYSKLRKAMLPLADKLVTAWQEAAKQDKEELKRDYAHKTRRKSGD